MKFQGKRKSSFWMESLSLACCPEVSSTSFSWKVGSLQGDEVGSAMTEEVTSSNGSKQQKAEAVSFADWRSVEVKTGLDRLGSGLSVVLAANEDSDGGEDYSILDQGKRIGKHAHDEELDQHSNNEITTAINAGERQHIEGAPEPGPKVGPANSSSHLDNPAPPPPPPLEHLFDKAVTPSDVGKLNRLVIPKQHAEKHFPLDVNYSDKGLLLNFEDNTGKAWRFRYSYWNSSQSYVLTKGWSRFVKDKKLEAGDIVSFHRGTPDTHQLYITWRRRPCGHQPVQTKEHASYFPLGALNPFHSARRVADYNPQWMHIYWPNSESPLGHLNAAVCPPQNPAIPLCLSAPVNRDLYLNIKRPGAVEGTAKKESPSTSSFDPATKAKEVRIFGVNLVEWQRLGVDELMLFPS